MLQSFFGTVERGHNRGKALGFPTANIPLADLTVSGVYAGKVAVEGKTYIAGIFADQKRKVLEAYLVDFSGDLYGKEIAIELHKKIREAGEFTDDETLKRQIAGDVSTVRAHFQSL